MKNIFVILSAIIAITLVSCEDPAPFEYKEAFIVEGYMIVGEKLSNLKVMRTQPLEESFVYENGFIKDANVFISTGDENYQLQWDDELQTYIYDDDNVKVQPLTQYNLRIEMSDGKIITGETTTPDTFSWVRRPKPVVQYPQDTIKLNANPDYDLQWSPVPDMSFYLIQVIAQDTLNYGRYLEPPTNEPNRRAYHLFLDVESYYREISSINLIANTRTPLVWIAVKWFGKQAVNVYCTDFNWILWAFDGGGALDPNFSSVKGGDGEDVYGCFGSASMISDTTFILKNQP